MEESREEKMVKFRRAVSGNAISVKYCMIQTITYINTCPISIHGRSSQKETVRWQWTVTVWRVATMNPIVAILLDHQLWRALSGMRMDRVIRKNTGIQYQTNSLLNTSLSLSLSLFSLSLCSSSFSFCNVSHLAPLYGLSLLVPLIQVNNTQLSFIEELLNACMLQR